jgi:hypothetical protein
MTLAQPGASHWQLRNPAGRRFMNPGIRFPKEADTIYEEAEAFRQLSPTDRLLAILDLIASGAELMRHSPNAEADQILREAEEAEWQRVQKELFKRHGF